MSTVCSESTNYSDDIVWEDKEVGCKYIDSLQREGYIEGYIEGVIIGLIESFIEQELYTELVALLRQDNLINDLIENVIKPMAIQSLSEKDRLTDKGVKKNNPSMAGKGKPGL